MLEPPSGDACGESAAGACSEVSREWPFVRQFGLGLSRHFSVFYLRLAKMVLQRWRLFEQHCIWAATRLNSSTADGSDRGYHQLCVRHQLH